MYEYYAVESPESHKGLLSYVVSLTPSGVFLYLLMYDVRRWSFHYFAAF